MASTSTTSNTLIRPSEERLSLEINDPLSAISLKSPGFFHERHESDDEDETAANTYTLRPMDDSFIRDETKRWLYMIMEDPRSSTTAFVFHVILALLITTSTVIIVLETIPGIVDYTGEAPWFITESFIMMLFGVEFMLRFFTRTDSRRALRDFITHPLTILDFFSFTPFFLELFLTGRFDTGWHRFACLRLVRLLRLFSAYKYTTLFHLSIEVMTIALRKSSEALSALLLLVFTLSTILSTFLYFAERQSQCGFDSIPTSFWFIVSTITTVGYGDMIPCTLLGKVLAMISLLVGTLMIALPSIIIGRYYLNVWDVMRPYKHVETLQKKKGDEPAMDLAKMLKRNEEQFLELKAMLMHVINAQPVRPSEPSLSS